MIVSVKVVPKSSKVEVKRVHDTLKVNLTKPASDGAANTQLIEVLAEHFNLKKYQITIVQGHTCRTKLVRIDEPSTATLQRKK